MNTSRPERELVIDLLDRSKCKVQVACILMDNHGIISWGWNHAQGETGVHAEIMALMRANRRRLKGSRIIVAGRWRKSRNWVPASPCEDCLPVVRKWGIKWVEHTNKDGGWNTWQMPYGL